tara:strand:- start:395 stop:568 length:174 start_codon:yes stop_codon:yes gene_type:complete
METNKLIRATKIAIHIALANERQAINKLEIAEEELKQARQISNNKISLLQELLEEEE